MTTLPKPAFVRVVSPAFPDDPRRIEYFSAEQMRELEQATLERAAAIAEASNKWPEQGEEIADAIRALKVPA